MFLKTTVFCVVFLASFAAWAASTSSSQTRSQQVATKTYDAKGKLVQRTTAQGRHYNARGQYMGKTTRQGRHYDAKGRYTGKTITTSRGTRTVDAKGKTVRQTKTPR